MRIVSRGEWGASPWANGIVRRAPARTEMLIHYHGAPPRHDRGPEMAHEIERVHLANGWQGVGYNFMVGQDGIVYEGRGWDLVGAHCPGHNTTGLGVYIAVGGTVPPTAAALTAARTLYDAACQRNGHALRKSYHGFDYPTECPGAHLRSWVKAGMPGATVPATKEEADMPLTTADLDLMFGTGKARYQVRDGKELIGLTEAVNRVLWLQRRMSERPVVDVDKLAAIVLDGLIKNGRTGDVTVTEIADELYRRLES